ncbi:hypothetical protein [Lentibacillus salicampi]|uniref:Uncharacterized protein n=1 Tax=Lentibacillus salicampi TaxID=175306 RepID=A0A4Y9A6A7_9BACI|nr:hypothetical protein [Lentibacillus salicampi]TFJ90658.1 hypothetical protein E4U82_19120 [Lentibacillus salicampi]
MGRSIRILKRSRIFYILVLALLNMTYVSIEIYKSKISKPLLENSKITQLEFAKLESMSNYALLFETAFLIISVIWTLLMFTKKYEPTIKSSIPIQLLLLVSLLILNCTLSWLFDAPIGNLTQLLFGPIVFTSGAVIYFLLSKLLSGCTKYNPGDPSSS